jgi:hypothetical protein
VIECLPNKTEVLSSNSSAAKSQGDVADLNVTSLNEPTACLVLTEEV